MDKLIDTLTGFPSSPSLSDAELSKQCTFLLQNTLNKVSAADLARNVNGTNLLDLLDPGVNSLPYIYVL